MINGSLFITQYSKSFMITRKSKKYTVTVFANRIALVRRLSDMESVSVNIESVQS